MAERPFFNGGNMEQLIKLWLKLRLPISNFLNRFDIYNKETNIDVDLPTYKSAIIYLQTLITNKYKYKYDFGDRIRTPNSVWNRAHNQEIFKDDCDGAAVLAMTILQKTKYDNANLLTVIPVSKFWEGHTVCLFLDLNKKYHIIDYGVVSPGFDSIALVIEYIVRTRYEQFNHFVCAIDDFENDRWINKLTFTFE